MTLQTNTPKSAPVTNPAFYSQRPACPRCGEVLLVAEESEFDVHGRIRHSWSCDSCGHEFRTSITLRRR